MSFQPAHKAGHEVHSTSLSRGDAPNVYITSDKFGEVALCFAGRGGLVSRMTFDADTARLIAAELVKAADSVPTVAEAA